MVEIEIFYLEIDLAKLQVGAFFLVDVTNIAVGDVDQGKQKAGLSLWFGLLGRTLDFFLFDRRFFFFLFLADGGEIELALGIANNSNRRSVQNHSFDLHFFF